MNMRYKKIKLQELSFIVQAGIIGGLLYLFFFIIGFILGFLGVS